MINIKNSLSRKSGFTLVEILIGLSVSAAIFLVATSLVVSVFGSTTKSRQKALFSQVKNDLQSEFGNSIRWASAISTNAVGAQVDKTKYELRDGRVFKDSSPITPETIEITEFKVEKFVPEVAESTVGSGLTGQYFSELDFKKLEFSQQDFAVDFDWGTDSPDPLIKSDRFSVRWVGQVLAPATGSYKFFVASDDGAKLWVGDTLLVDDWSIPGFDENQGSITLTGGEKYDLQLLYFDNFGDARVRLSWDPPGSSKDTIPTNMLYPKSGPVSLEISIKMRIKTSTSLVDDLHLILSPRGGSVITVE